MADEHFPIETVRHSTAHILAGAVLELFPDTKLGVGPVIENGFFYDFDLEHKFTPVDLLKIEKRIKEIQKRKEKFVRREMPLEEAIAYFKGRGQDFKVELLEDIKKHGTTKMDEILHTPPQPSLTLREGEKISTPLKIRGDKGVMKVSVYETGKFIDLCRGPHVEHSGQIGVFKLTSIAGAYWRGSEKNKQLQRIYGLAFYTEDELKKHLEMMAEAEKRDHRKLGEQLDLFTFSDLFGPGLPLWTPKGTFLRNTLDNFVWELRAPYGYQKVEIPHITKKDLYEKSGHWQKFKDELFKITTREGHEFAMKPMNCPHHTQLYARLQFSYRELPQRYANTTTCYRDEQTGELHGLSRVRAFTQDDAHVFCRTSQIGKEISNIWEIIKKFYKAAGFSLTVRLSLHDHAQMDKYLGEEAQWQNAEGQLRAVIKEKREKAIEAKGEAAFYGPKIDFLAKDSLGRQWQVATIQLDMNQPERFDLTCVNEKGEKERIVMIHAAIMGSIERYLSILIEHYGGAFPVWLAPVQVYVGSVGKGHSTAVRKLGKMLSAEGLRVETDDGNDTVGYKIRKAEKQKIPYMLVIGDKEKSLRKLTVRIRGQQKQPQMAVSAFIKRVKKEIENKT